MDTVLTDLFQAYCEARRNKRNTASQLRFELNVETNLIELYHELKERRYKPAPYVCFIVSDSVKREVYASEFRDRVVHHLYYNYVYDCFDKQFIYDSYSCRKGKGTLFGINRLQHHIRSASKNYTQPAYILKLDIQGYFMSINRSLLCQFVKEMIQKVALSEQTKDFVTYLTEVIIYKDPLQGRKIKGNLSDWQDLPPSKCLEYSPKGVGLPIGDLTSQLFSNVFLNKLDRFITIELGFKHYGRYVDDFYIVDTNQQHLKASKAKIANMLSGLGLTLHPQKIKLQSVYLPITFFGAVVYPFYRHCSARTTHKYIKYSSIYQQLCNIPEDISIDVCACVSTMKSYLGYLRHFKAYSII